MRDAATFKTALLFGVMFGLLVLVGMIQSWSVALTILNLCLVSAIMALGVNMQWGYAGLFNVGVMGFAALGGLAVVLVSMPPVGEAWEAGGLGIGLGLLICIFTVISCLITWSYVKDNHRWRYWIILIII